MKIKRHEDVIKFGRSSKEVKSDDDALNDLIKRDQELRSEERTAIRQKKVSRHHRGRNKHDRRSGSKVHVSFGFRTQL